MTASDVSNPTTAEPGEERSLARRPRVPRSGSGHGRGADMLAEELTD
ncbi:hypothetical protein [Arthrobacter sp. H14-L1]|nr:hypothetical protein [Arthrobacter sp. H14-L1]